jgi:hypothetical protein
MTDPVRPVAPREAIERTRIMFEQHRDQCWEQVYTKSEHGSSFLARDFAVRAEVWDLAARCLADSLAAAPVPCAASPADTWQPIETAPKDKRVLALMKPEPLASEGEITWAYWTTPVGVWTYDDTGEVCEPTHWLPLPTPPRATGEGARDEGRAMVSVQSSVDRSGRATDSTRAAVASDRPARAGDGTGQALPLQQLRGSPEHADTDAPVAVSLDPHRLLQSIRALVQQWRERVAVCLRISAEVGAAGDMALAQAWHEEADHKDECANELAALCPAPPEDRK